jgi:aminobenzoyl-glutamate utilization protein A
MIAARRDFHCHPEPGWAEYRTAAKVAAALSALGFETVAGKEACLSESRMGLPDPETLRIYQEKALQLGADPKWLKRMEGGHTGVVGILRGKKPGPVIALRFDMDALPVEESAEPYHPPAAFGFRSHDPGMMHACGHDGHTAIGLGVAEALAACRDELAGEVRLLFQPAEEGCRGAKSMVDAGWLDDAEYFFSGHIGFKSFELGEIVASTGGFMATAKIDAQFRGRAAHAGEAPEQGRNALLAAAAAVLHLHGISRHGGGATRINVGKLQAGSGRNIVPDYAEMQLETRGETEELNRFMIAEACRILEHSALMYGAECSWNIAGQGLDGEGDPDLVPLIRQAASQMKAVKTVVPYKPFGASEDVTFMLHKVKERGGKGTYMLFGSPLKQGHHQPGFDFDEQVLPIAAELLVRLVLSCHQHSSAV